MQAAFLKNRLFTGLCAAVQARVYWIGDGREIQAGGLFPGKHQAPRERLARSPEISSDIYRDMLEYLVTRLRPRDHELEFFL